MIAELREEFARRGMPLREGLEDHDLLVGQTLAWLFGKGDAKGPLWKLLAIARHGYTLSKYVDRDSPVAHSEDFLALVEQATR